MKLVHSMGPFKIRLRWLYYCKHAAKSLVIVVNLEINQVLAKRDAELHLRESFKNSWSYVFSLYQKLKILPKMKTEEQIHAWVQQQQMNSVKVQQTVGIGNRIELRI